MQSPRLAGFRRSIGIALAAKEAVRSTTLWAFAWGAFVIAWRVGSRQTPSWLAWGLAAFPILALAASWRAWRKLPSQASLRAAADQRSHCGGMLMAADETPLAGWQTPEPLALRVRWNWGRPVAALLCGFAFLAAALLVPQRFALLDDPTLEIGADVRKLASAIDVLQEEKIVERSQAEQLKDKLRQIQDEASGRDPKKTFDALDHMMQALTRTARNAAEDAGETIDKLRKAKRLAEAVAKEEGTLDAKIKEDALKELHDLVSKAAEEAKSLDNALDEELRRELKDGDLTAEQLKELADALKGAKGELQAKLGKLSKARLIDPKQLKKCEGDPGEDGECDGEECEGSVAKMLARLSQRSGRGGRAEGPGHSPIQWSDGSKEEGAKFKEQSLPPASLAQLKESIKVGISRAEPKAGEATASQGGGLVGAAVGGGGAHAATLLPQHRAAVQRFFARNK